MKLKNLTNCSFKKDCKDFTKKSLRSLEVIFASVVEELMHSMWDGNIFPKWVLTHWAISVFLTFFPFWDIWPWIRSPQFPPGWSQWQVWSKTNERKTKIQIFSCWIWNNVVIKAERWPTGPVIQWSWFLWLHTLTCYSFTCSSSWKAAQQLCWNDLHRHASGPSLL